MAVVDVPTAGYGDNWRDVVVSCWSFRVNSWPQLSDEGDNIRRRGALGWRSSATVTGMTPDYAALGSAVKARRGELGNLSQGGVAERGGPSELTVRKIEQARNGPYRPQTLDALDVALGWKPGTCAAILDGTAGDDPTDWTLGPVQLEDETSRPVWWEGSTPPQSEHLTDAVRTAIAELYSTALPLKSADPALHSLRDVLREVQMLHEEWKVRYRDGG